MAYRVIEICRDLPQRKACTDCGKPGCLAFATSLYLEGRSLTACPHLSEEQRRAMEVKAEDGRLQGEGEAPEEQAAQLLQSVVAKSDLAELASRAEATCLPGPPPIVGVPYLGQTYQVGDRESPAGAEQVTSWTIFVGPIASRIGF